MNVAELARLSAVSHPTARQFLRHLEISYQIVLLPAWFRNLEKRLSRQPKLHFVDQGVRRAIIGKRGAVDGAEFESAVVSEIVKQCRTARLPVTFSFLRTADGLEVDLLVEREDGFIAIECKQSARVAATDFRHLARLGGLLDKPLLVSLVVSGDLSPRKVLRGSPPSWNVAACQLLAAARSAPRHRE